MYPVLRRFLVETGLQRTLKAFDKETAPEDEEAAPTTKAKKKLAKKLATCELLAAVQSWLEASGAAAAPAAVEPVAEAPAPTTPRKRAKSDASEAGKKRKKSAEVVVAAEVAQEEPQPKKKRKASADLSEAKPKVEATEEPAPASKKEKKKAPAVAFSRVDHDKWVAVAAAKDKRLLDNTHEAKDKYGKMGDSWGDAASADLLAVKGKGFRKEMAKKKRASWRGGGEISQVTNSIPFSDSDDE